MAGSTFASRLRALRSDLAAVAGVLVGRSAETTSLAAKVPVARSSSSSLAPRPLRVARVVRETADTVSLVLEDPYGAPIHFAPGQFFTLHVRIGDEVHKRAYSASSSALDSTRVSVTIKRVSDGLVSRHLVTNIHEGDVLDVLGPSGLFTPAPAATPRVLVLIGGGSGITPLASI
ncbi:MAG: FAD-binding oxidoreductase, partial [Polyangiaceae bacterium]